MRTSASGEKDRSAQKGLHVPQSDRREKFSAEGGKKVITLSRNRSSDPVEKDIVKVAQKEMRETNRAAISSSKIALGGGGDITASGGQQKKQNKRGTAIFRLGVFQAIKKTAATRSETVPDF